MAFHQTDLFAKAPLAGLTTADNHLCPKDETTLIALIDAADLSPFRFQQWTGKRLTASYGWHYDFERGMASRADPMPSALLTIRARAAEFAGLDATALVQALLIRYDPGAGIGWHRDRPLFEHVVGISLGAPAILRFRQRAGERDGRTQYRREALPLAPRSIYHLAGAARWDWEHSIAPMAEPRWSVTFRSLSDRGRMALRDDG